MAHQKVPKTQNYHRKKQKCSYLLCLLAASAVWSSFSQNVKVPSASWDVNFLQSPGSTAAGGQKHLSIIGKVTLCLEMDCLILCMVITQCLHIHVCQTGCVVFDLAVHNLWWQQVKMRKRQKPTSSSMNMKGC